MDARKDVVVEKFCCPEDNDWETKGLSKSKLKKLQKIQRWEETKGMKRFAIFTILNSQLEDFHEQPQSYIFSNLAISLGSQATDLKLYMCYVMTIILSCLSFCTNWNSKWDRDDALASRGFWYSPHCEMWWALWYFTVALSDNFIRVENPSIFRIIRDKGNLFYQLAFWKSYSSSNFLPCTLFDIIMAIISVL